LNDRRRTSRAASPLLLRFSTRRCLAAACHADVQRARHGSQTWYAAARLWYAAEDAAVRAACGSWRDAPLGGCVGVGAVIAALIAILIALLLALLLDL
jgi:hypothetical protein